MLIIDYKIYSSGNRYLIFLKITKNPKINRIFKLSNIFHLNVVNSTIDCRLIDFGTYQCKYYILRILVKIIPIIK